MEHTIAPSDVSDLLRRPLSKRSGSLIEGLHDGQCSSSTGKLCAKPHAKAHRRALCLFNIPFSGLQRFSCHKWATAAQREGESDGNLIGMWPG